MYNAIVSFNEDPMKSELHELARNTRETINAMLDEEADQFTGAWQYDRPGRYERNLTTKSG